MLASEGLESRRPGEELGARRSSSTTAAEGEAQLAEWVRENKRVGASSLSVNCKQLKLGQICWVDCDTT